MNTPKRMLELAQTLATLDPRRPRQVTLRRAVSTAYYAFFHLLGEAYAALFSNDPKVRAAIFRTINHKDIATAARDFAAVPARLPKALPTSVIAIPAELSAVARAFSDIQDQRHDADYDLTFEYTRPEVITLISDTHNAFENWEKARTTPAARLFLACFQLKKTWDLER